MKILRILLGLKTSIMSPADVLFNAGTGCWNRSSLRFLTLQVVHNFSSSQTEVIDNFSDKRWSAETARFIHQRAYEKPPTPDEEAVEFSSANRVIQPTTPADTIKQYFNVSKTTAYSIMDRDERLKNCNVHILSRNMNTLQKNGVDPLDVRNYMVLLYRCPLTTEHNIAVMKELGLNNLTVADFTQAVKLFKTRVSLLKSRGKLPEHYDPLETLASLEMPDHVLDSVEFSDNINNLTLAQLHQKLSSMYLSWRLNCSKEEVSKLQQKYRLAKKSMMLQHKILLQLKHDWNINISKVQQNGYLLTCSPVNMALIDSKVKQIGGISVKYYALMTPRIFTIPYHLLLQVDHILTKLQLPQASLKALPRICTLHPDTLQKRINHLQQIPELFALWSHPRMLHLIYSHKKVTSRLDLLQQAKTTTVVPSLNRLSGTEKNFNKYMTVGDLKQNKRDVIMCLSIHLSVKPAVIRKCLHRQCWGPQTTVVNVQRNLSTLRELGFTEEQLMAGLDVVLYPPDLLSDQLAQLPHRAQAQPFSVLKSSISILQLLLYFMEKNAPFTYLR